MGSHSSKTAISNNPQQIMQNVSTYLVLVTCALSASVLAFVLYASFGLAALKAVAPFVGTLGLTFLAAHFLDASNAEEDSKAKATNARTQGRGPSTPSSAAAGTIGSGGIMGGPSSSTTLPKRRRVAD